MSTPAVTGDPVSNSDDAAVLLAWITLSRVADGGVTQRGGHYLDEGSPQQITLTTAGQTRHERLRRRAVREMDQ